MNAALSILPQQWPELNVAALFGLLLLAGTLGGLLAKRIAWLPTITGFMAVGLVIGPHGLGLLSPQTLAQGQVLVDVALGLILFRLGTALHPWLVLRNPRFVITSLAECLLTFGAVFALMRWLGTDSVAAVIAAAIAVSSSPAVLIHVAQELDARGFVIETAKSLVAFNNVAAYVLFSLVMPIALWRADVQWTVAVALPAYQLLGAMLLGVVVAFVVTRIGTFTQQHDAHYRFALIVGAVMLVLGLSVMLKVSPLFANLSFGIACRGLQRRARLAGTELGSGADVFYIILFVFAGANLHIEDMAHFWQLAVAFVLVRSAAKVLAVLATGTALGYPPRQTLATGLTLLPMAGLAIGLVQTTAKLLPHLSTQLGAIVLAAVAIFETFGPPIVAYALRMSGCVGHDQASEPGQGSSPVAKDEPSALPPSRP